MRWLEAFPDEALAPDCVAVRKSVAGEHGLIDGEAVFVSAYHDPSSRIFLESWQPAAEDELGPDGCLVHPELLVRLEAMAPDRLVVLRSGKSPLPSFYTLSWTFQEPVEIRRPEDLIVLIDASSSMEGAPLRHAKRALLSFVDQKRASGLDDRLGLVAFGGSGAADVRVVCLPTGDDPHHQDFVDGLRTLRADGLTPMAAALAKGMELVVELDADENRRRRIILVTDGHPYPGDAEEVRKLARDLAAAKIHVATVGVGDHFDRQLLTFIAARTGAPCLEAHSIRQLPHLLEALARDGNPS